MKRKFHHDLVSTVIFKVPMKMEEESLRGKRKLLRNGWGKII
jgi:hypothetical protein